MFFYVLEIFVKMTILYTKKRLTFFDTHVFWHTFFVCRHTNFIPKHKNKKILK